MILFDEGLSICARHLWRVQQHHICPRRTKYLFLFAALIVTRHDPCRFFRHCLTLLNFAGRRLGRLHGIGCISFFEWVGQEASNLRLGAARHVN